MTHPVFDPALLAGFHLLESDAGTGKTWTIAGLVVRALVERGLPISDILVVTFTNAATAELAARIRERIEQLVRRLEDDAAGRTDTKVEVFCDAYARGLADPVAALRRLRVALAQIDEASVWTIHGYCHRVLAEHALSIGVPDGLRAQALGNEWIERGVADWWRANASGADDDVLALLDTVGVTPPRLVEEVAAIDALPGARIVPGPGEWRTLAPAFAQARATLARALDADEAELRRWFSGKGQYDGKRYQARWIDGWIATIRDFARGGGAPGGRVPEEVGRFSSATIAGEQGRFKVPELRVVGACDALVAIADDVDAVPARVACEVHDAIAQRRLALKSAAGAIGHDDLLRLVQAALAREPGGAALAAAMRERHPLALVDECQDTDALQWDIFRRVYAPREAMSEGLILVGDPKQAIYAFRSADVYTYLDAARAGPRVHALRENQRASRALIEAGNALFARSRPFLVDEIGFTDARMGAKPRHELACRGEVRAPMVAVRVGGGDDDAMLDRESASDASVGATVAEIGRLLAPGAARIGDRPLAASDVAVLVASHHQATTVKRALAAAGIGAVEVSRASVLESAEFTDLFRVVAAISDPSDAGLVRSALATVLVDRPVPASGADGPPSGALADLVQRLAQARDAWAWAGPHAAVLRLLHALGAPSRLAALRDGDRRLTNLAHVLDLLSGADEARESAGTALRWMARVRDDPGALASEACELRLESSDDLVRILTVHKSKGLEFPVVFLPFAWNVTRFRGEPPLRFHARGEDGEWHAVLDFLADKDSGAWSRAALEDDAEGLRELYVAITRAEQRCYVFWGAVSGAQRSPLAWLLEGLDPGAQVDWKRNAKDAPVLTHSRAAGALERWRDAACAREPGAMEVLDAESMRVGGGAAAAHGTVDDSGPGEGAAGAADTACFGAPHGDAAARTLAARPFLASVPGPWIHASFTGIAQAIVRGEPRATPGSVRADHDQSVPSADAPARAEAGAAADARTIRAAFPAGAQAGTCLHAMLELADFARGVDASLAERCLVRSGYAPALAGPVAAWLDEVVRCPLRVPGAGEVRLADLAPASMARELEFQLPAHHVDDRALVGAVAREFPLQAQVASSSWSGFLHGFVDLVFEHDGRWHVLDWKSNRLGEHASDYHREALERSVDEHAYALHFCLYTLALHRLLRGRVPGYSYERDFGAVHYVYLRGAGAPAAEPAQPLGVYTARPSAALVDTLDRLFEGSR